MSSFLPWLTTAPGASWDFGDRKPNLLQLSVQISGTRAASPTAEVLTGEQQGRRSQHQLQNQLAKDSALGQSRVFVHLSPPPRALPAWRTGDAKCFHPEPQQDWMWTPAPRRMGWLVHLAHRIKDISIPCEFYTGLSSLSLRLNADSPKNKLSSAPLSHGWNSDPSISTNKTLQVFHLAPAATSSGWAHQEKANSREGMGPSVLTPALQTSPLRP